jgi:DNA-binding transcriptional LysR family regulator
MNLSLANLRMFVRAAELGSFTAAAHALSISQPALSRAIGAMERQIGARLFDRHTRKLSLTPAGQELLSLAARLLAEMDAGLAAYAEFLDGRRGRIAVSVLPSAAMLLPDAVRRFREQFPMIDVNVRDGSQNPLLDDVMRGRSDFAVTMDPDSDEFRFRPLLADDFVFLGDRDILGGRSRVGWTIFRDRPFVGLAIGSSIRSMTDAAFAQLGIQYRPRYECGYPATVVSLVQAGLGVTALPRLTVPTTLGNRLATAELRGPAICRRIGVVTRAGLTLPPPALRLIDILCGEVGKKRPAAKPAPRQ